MAHHTVIEAKSQLSELIIRAASGEHVVVTHPDGQAVELRLIVTQRDNLPPPPPTGDGRALADWFRKVQVGRIIPGAPDAAELVRRMRDEGY